MPADDPTVKEFFDASDRHDITEAEQIPDDVRDRANEMLADDS